MGVRELIKESKNTDGNREVTTTRFARWEES